MPAIKQVKIYPLSQAGAPPGNEFVNLSAICMNLVHANDFAFYEEVNELVQAEPTDALDAGLQPRGMIGIQPCFGPDDPDGAALLVGIVRTLLPLMERSGVATADEIDLATLQDRLSDEMTSARAIFAHPMLFSAWATVDGPP